MFGQIEHSNEYRMFANKSIKKYQTLNKSLLVMIEKRCQSLDKRRHYGTLLKSLSKTSGCLSHDLLIAKLHVLVLIYQL